MSGGRPRGKAWLGLLGRTLAGGVFAYAGFIKAAAPVEEFAYAIESYRILSPFLSLAAAYILPWAELLLGLLLLAGLYTKPAAAAAGALLVGFEGFLLSVIIRKIPVTNCGCFGAGVSSSPPTEFALNLLTLAASYLAWKYGRAFAAETGTLQSK